MESNMNLLHTAVVLGLIGPMTSNVALAAAPDGDAQISFSSHQLATAAGRAAVIVKIVGAARRACIEPGFRPDTTTMACTRDVAEAMIVKVGDPQLAMLWQGKGACEIASGNPIFDNSHASQRCAGKARSETFAVARIAQTETLAPN